MSLQYTVESLKLSILNGSDPKGDAAQQAIDDMLAFLQKQRDMLPRYVEFAGLTGETFTIPELIAQWIDKATCHNPFNDTTERLKYVSVCDHAERRWLAATDGFRIHAHTTDLELGVYLMVDNKLRAVNSKHVNWCGVVPVEPTPVTVGECKEIKYPASIFDDDVEIAFGWFFNGKKLTKTGKGTPYRLHPRFWNEALSFGVDPTFSIGELRQGDTENYMRRMVITWPDAFAVIIPMRPEPK